VCKFVELNQVQWLDIHNRHIVFDRAAILKGAIISVDCLRTVEQLKITPRSTHCGNQKRSDQENRAKTCVKVIGNEFYLLAIFDEIMNACASANGKRIWMCKSMGMSQFHEMLLTFYGKERLRYIYLCRDARDVVLSFKKTPVGDCHPFAIATKWATLQNRAIEILHTNPDLIHQVRYENILKQKAEEVAKIMDFMGSRGHCKTMRRGSVVEMQSEIEMTSNAKSNREASNASLLSTQFKNLTRGESFAKEQFQKWAKGMDEEDIRIVESVAFNEMKLLGYEPHLVKNNEGKQCFTEAMVTEFGKLNEELIEKMKSDLARENPDDLKRRNAQGSVLIASTSNKTYDSVFRGLDITDRNYVYDSEDEEQNRRLFDTRGINFSLWPKDASLVGFLSETEVAERFQIQDTQTLKLGNKLSLKFAAATQRGYYPSDKNKRNQDAFLAGACVRDDDFKNAFFAVYDGHGRDGDKCACLTRDIFHEVITNDSEAAICESNDIGSTAKTIELSENEPFSSTSTLDASQVNVSTGYMVNANKKVSTRNIIRNKNFFRRKLGAKEKKQSSQQDDRIKNIITESYQKANDELSYGVVINAESSGTTATTLCVTKDTLYAANVGDSRCLLVSNVKGSTRVSMLTKDHSPDREDEQERIKECGGVIMTSSQYDVKDDKMLSFEPKRVWSKEGKWPGTAFTRSIGDTKAKELGVCADPEYTKVRISQDDTMFVLGSDGIFDFISNEAVADIVSEYSDPSEACKALVGIAYNKWSENEERTDDITVIVGHIEHNPSPSFFGGALRKVFGLL
jgi:serine/threonine protein phosphatase PrpC